MHAHLLSTCTHEEILSMCILPLTQTMKLVISAVQSFDHLHICNHVKAAHRRVTLVLCQHVCSGSSCCSTSVISMPV